MMPVFAVANMDHFVAELRLRERNSQINHAALFFLAVQFELLTTYISRGLKTPGSELGYITLDETLPNAISMHENDVGSFLYSAYKFFCKDEEAFYLDIVVSVVSPPFTSNHGWLAIRAGDKVPLIRVEYPFPVEHYKELFYKHLAPDRQSDHVDRKFLCYCSETKEFSYRTEIERGVYA
jgi:hypothetical protein